MENTYTKHIADKLFLFNNKTPTEEEINKFIKVEKEAHNCEIVFGNYEKHKKEIEKESKHYRVNLKKYNVDKHNLLFNRGT